MDVPQTELYALMENTVRDHEGNSTLVIGPRGSGKTVLISQCLAQLEANYHGEYLVIRLNSFIHADDDSALREIAAQFARGLRSQGVESGPIETRQLTTTFSNILRILDNPDADDTMSIIFVIDDLETFTSGNKQILLYNLFELTQSSRTPICIIGTSTKFTTRELLEKRVRSRFSQRLVVINKFSQFDQFCQNCLNNLRLDQDQISTLENPQYGRQWNSHIDALASTDSCLRRVLSLNFNTSRNIKMFNNSAMLPVSQISTTSPYPLDSQFMGLIHNQIKNPIEAMFNALSPLELLLVVAAARFIEKSSLVTVNFNIAYQEYADMMKQYNIDKSIVRSSSVTTHNIPTNLKVNVKVWDPTVLKNCWMSLYRHGLLIDYTPNTAEGGKFTATSNRSFVLEDSRMLQLDLTLAEIGQLLPDDNGFRALTRL
ncbi:hypothetical protein CANTEDRAFT_120716 [Yamadazyma tenuis ATCC 10573]|uniref:Origin recognition complex subunit 4 n=2 Tax=Candida tenuis TaxID=2315449 RepID=G3B2T7_CANTC|nr:uncharacterized protein CANTEDRAFT_120716 [Yamadazyma tenuis ATCC 10573]EGV64759.1 hypothetical protein CANTEDRAFT_120716 [Yamadazyma tenuis ATCC 10573]